MSSVYNWLIGAQSNNENDNIEEKKETKQANSLHLGALYMLHGLQKMAKMNGKICKIVGALNISEQRYPVLVYETNQIVLIKPSNLHKLDKKTTFIKDIILYPIKGCKGISLSSSIINNYGLKYDREYCLMSKKRHKIISQSSKPKICFISPSIPTENGIKISAPNMNDSIYVKKTYDIDKRIKISYWNYKQGIYGYDQGDIISKWLTKYFILSGYDKYDEIRLILFDPNFKRITHKKDTSINYLNKNKNTISMVTFSNEFQFLICSQESLNGLNHRIKSNRLQNNDKYNVKMDKIRMDRFRPNIVVSSNGFYSANWEDNIKIFATNNGIKFYFSKPCPRCGMPSINQQTGKRYKEPKQTLLKYRTGQKLNYLKEANWKMKLFFGSYFIHDKCGEIQRGEQITI